MYLRKIIKEELEANEFANLIELMHSKQVENIELALMLAQHCEEQFKKEFGYSVKEYTELFENKLKEIITNANIYDKGQFIIKTPEFYYLFNQDDIIVSDILVAQPKLINKFDLAKLDSDDICWILYHHPQFIDKFDLSKLNGNDIYPLLCNQPQFIDKFDLSKLNRDEISWLLKSQPQLKPYFDKFKKK